MIFEDAAEVMYTSIFEDAAEVMYTSAIITNVENKAIYNKKC